MKNFFLKHWDFVVSLLVAVEVYRWMPAYLPLMFTKEIYSGGIAVMAIIFSIVFAAIAVIASGGESKFIAFWEDSGAGFSRLMNSFKITLNILFVALLISVLEFSYAVFRMVTNVKDQSSIFLAVFIFFLLWALLAARLVGTDAIKFAQARARFARDEESREEEATSK